MTDAREPDPTEAIERRRIDADDVSWAFREANRAAGELESEVARRLALRQTEYDAMVHLMATPKPLGPNELARRLDISPASTTDLVDRLEAAGHLHRVRSQTDRRRVELHASPESAGRIVGEIEPLIAALDRVAAALDTEERRVIIAYLREVSDAIHRFVEDSRADDYP